MNLLEKMIAAKAELEGLGKPLSELRIHPDDHKDLVRQCEPLLRYPSQGAVDSFNGLKIVIDSDAPRFPKKSTGHEFDEDAVCIHCGFDGAEWSHWKHNTWEGKASDAKQPLCTRV